MEEIREPVKIKICGLMTLEDVAAVNAAKPDYAGFVLAKSRRRISREHARLLRMELDPSIRAVGVFVNELPQIVAGYLEDGIIDIVQLHGQEDETYLRRLRFLTGEPVIQAFSVESAADLEKAEICVGTAGVGPAALSPCRRHHAGQCGGSGSKISSLWDRCEQRCRDRREKRCGKNHGNCQEDKKCRKVDLESMEDSMFRKH